MCPNYQIKYNKNNISMFHYKCRRKRKNLLYAAFINCSAGAKAMKNVEEQSAGCASFTPWPFSMQWSSSQHCWREKICTHHQGKQLFFYGHANVCKSLVSGIFRNEGMLTWELSAGMSSSCLVELSSMVFLKLGPKLHLHRADDSREKKKRKGKKKQSKKKI